MTRRTARLALLLGVAALLAACAHAPSRRAGAGAQVIPPHNDTELLKTPDAVPHVEPRSPYGNPPSYTVYGHRYVVLATADGYLARGLASWYGPSFQGQRTSSGEIYDMFGMTAAHKTLPLPCYARVTNLTNGRSVVVRINDRGPFVGDRLIDLSYTAALKLDMIRTGTAWVEVQTINPSAPVTPLPAAPLLPVTPLTAQAGREPGAVTTTTAGAVSVMTANAAASSSMAAAGAAAVQSADSAAPAARVATSIVASNTGVQDSTPAAVYPPITATATAAATPVTTAPAVQVTGSTVPAGAYLAAAGEPGAALPTAAGVEAVMPSAATPVPAATPVAATGAATGNAGATHPIYIQVGAYANSDNARRAAHKLRAAGLTQVFTLLPSAGQSLLRVRIGPLADLQEFDLLIARLVQLGFSDARLAQE